MSSPAEFEDIAQYLFPLAIEILEKTGSFYPCAAFIDTEGKLEAYAVYLGEHPDRQEVYDTILENFRRDAPTKGYRAVGICADGLGPHPDGSRGDAILLLLEHNSGTAITVSMPYMQDSEKYLFADTTAYDQPPQVFV